MTPQLQKNARGNQCECWKHGINPVHYAGEEAEHHVWYSSLQAKLIFLTLSVPHPFWPNDKPVVMFLPGNHIIKVFICWLKRKGHLLVQMKDPPRLGVLLYGINDVLMMTYPRGGHTLCVTGAATHGHSR